jgi:regulator of extracellular matrix RemA (YlzA/DUF370 family)
MSLADQYETIRREAASLAGAPADIPQRAAMLHEIFLDSAGNHGFAEVAAHGALWGYRYFETAGTLGRLVSYRYFYNPRERRYRHGLLQSFADGFKEANRSVFIDTYSNYHFTKQFGEEHEATSIVRPELLAALRTIHRAARAGELLDAATRGRLFRTVLEWEQETTVAPKVQEEIARFDCPILKRLVMKPIVRFGYFPRLRYFWFRNFGDTAERVRNACRSFRLAEQAGWDRVTSSIQGYGVLEETFFRRPTVYLRELKARLSADAAVVRQTA